MMAAHVLLDGIPDRGGVPFSTFKSDCDDKALVVLSVKTMIQYDRD